MEQEKRIAVLEARVDGFGSEFGRTSSRLDKIESDVHRFTYSLESFLGRISIDDKLLLVPESKRTDKTLSPLSLRPSPFQTTSPILLTSSLTNTNQDSFPTPSSSNHDVPSEAVPATPAPSAQTESVFPAPAFSRPSDPVLPSLHLIPATPQGSQERTSGAVPVPAPAPIPVLRNRARSRTPAAYLLPSEGRITRSRSRSKTPNE